MCLVLHQETRSISPSFNLPDKGAADWESMVVNPSGYTPASGMRTASSVLTDRSRYSSNPHSLNGPINPENQTPQIMHTGSRDSASTAPVSRSISPRSAAPVKMGIPIDVPQPTPSTAFPRGPFNNHPFDGRNVSSSVPGPTTIPSMNSSVPPPGMRGQDFPMSLNSSGPNFCSHVTNVQNHARRSSEGTHAGAHGFREGGKRLANEMRCEHCGKGYKHSSCLTKHMWEHNPAWAYTSKLAMSKHQQVQMLEAASVLVSMNPPNPSLTPPHSAGVMPAERLQPMLPLDSTPAASCPTDVMLQQDHTKDTDNIPNTSTSTRDEPQSERSSKSPVASRSANTSPSPSVSLDEGTDLSSTKSNVPPFNDFNYTAVPRSSMRASHSHAHSHSSSNFSNVYRDHDAPAHNQSTHNFPSHTGVFSMNIGTPESDMSSNRFTADEKLEENRGGSASRIGDGPTLSTLIQSYENCGTTPKSSVSNHDGLAKDINGGTGQNMIAYEEANGLAVNANENASSSSVTTRPAFSVPSYSGLSQPASFSLPGLSYNISDVREMRDDLKENRQSAKGKTSGSVRPGIHDEHDHFNDDYAAGIDGDEEEEEEEEDPSDTTGGVAISNSASTSVTRESMRRKYLARREAREKMKMRRKQHIPRSGNIRGRRFIGSGSFPAYSHVDAMSMPSEQFFAKQRPYELNSPSSVAAETSKVRHDENQPVSMTTSVVNGEFREPEPTTPGIDEDASMDDFDGVFGKMEE